MISLVFFTVILFAALWAWIAYEYQHAVLITIDEEMELDEQVTSSSARIEKYDLES